MKTFFSLVQEVLKPGLCSRCGGCVTFCTAVNYGALEIDPDGKPFYGNVEKCIECGLCYSICPETKDLDEKMKLRANWRDPIGHVIETTVARASDEAVRSAAPNGGAVTALLAYLFEKNLIDGVVSTRSMGGLRRKPFLAESRQAVLEASSSGFYPDFVPCTEYVNDPYLTCATVEQIAPVVRCGLKRVAFVGAPCQIKFFRKMQLLNLVPSDTVEYLFGLFCSGSFVFGEKERQRLARAAKVSWDDVLRINVRDNLVITLKSGETRTLELSEMDFLKRSACQYCHDYSAEFADLSFGGMGARAGWTTVISRTAKGRKLLEDGLSFRCIEPFNVAHDAEFASRALRCVRKASAVKKKNARYKRRALVNRPVKVNI